MTATQQRLTNQGFFTESLEYLRNQETQAYEAGECAYVTEDGNRCVIGRLIPDNHPALDVVGPLTDLAPEHADLFGVAWPDTFNGFSLAEQVQQLHDYPDNRLESTGGLSETGEQAAKQIAVDFGLEYTPPTT